MMMENANESVKSEEKEKGGHIQKTQSMLDKHGFAVDFIASFDKSIFSIRATRWVSYIWARCACMCVCVQKIFFLPYFQMNNEALELFG